MNKIVDICILVLFLFATLLIGITRGEEKLTPFEQLKKDVESAPYKKTDYVRDVNDCSNMAATMVEHLDAKGYNAEIVVVQTRQSYCDKWNLIGRRGYHAFVIVDRQAIVEATYKLITFSEGKYEDSGSIDWYIEAWDIIGVYANRENAIKQSRWGVSEW